MYSRIVCNFLPTLIQNFFFYYSCFVYLSTENVTSLQIARRAEDIRSSNRNIAEGKLLGMKRVSVMTLAVF